MSWSGTVTCSHCYQRGHNKRKCPSLSAQIKSEYEDAVVMVNQQRERGNENDAKWYEQRAEEKRQLYIKRTKIDLATGEKVTNKAAKAERMKNVTCGYCGQRGHTRRVCEVVKRDKLVFIEESRRERLAAFEHAANCGIGAGSMLPIRTSGWNAANEYGTYTTLRYVKSIDWDACDSSRPKLFALHTDARKLGTPGQRQHTSRDSIDNLVKSLGLARDHALSEEQPVPMASLIANLDPPAEWFKPTEENMKENLQREFPTQGTSDNKRRNWSYKYPEGNTIEAIKELGLQEHYDLRHS
tara:strand:- start:369 stop:1262 length:894 start_codon:yes stop_codon:yes gene_type:complete